MVTSCKSKISSTDNKCKQHILKEPVQNELSAVVAVVGHFLWWFSVFLTLHVIPTIAFVTVDPQYISSFGNLHAGASHISAYGRMFSDMYA